MNKPILPADAPEGFHCPAWCTADHKDAGNGEFNDMHDGRVMTGKAGEVALIAYGSGPTVVYLDIVTREVEYPPSQVREIAGALLKAADIAEATQ